MKTHKYLLGAFLLIGVCLSPFASHADMFGSDEKKWEKVFSDLKKISVRLTDNVDVQLKGLQASQAELLSQISNLKSAIPALQGAVELTAQRLGKMDEQLAALEMKVKMQLDDQKKSLQETSNALRQGLAGDMDNLAKRNSEAQATVVSGFANIDTNNKKMIEILAKTLQENQDMSKNMNSFSKSLAEVHDQVKLDREMVAKLKEIITVKLDSLAKDEGAFRTQVDGNLKVIDGSLKAMEEKASQSTLKVDSGMANVDLANQKLSRLIEILKAFAVEQEKIVKNQAEISNVISDIQGKLNSHPAKTEVKKPSKKEKAVAPEGKHKKTDD